MRIVLPELINNLQNNQPCIIGAIVRSTGSAPRATGARMLIDGSGRLHGTIGGGELEAKSITAAREMLESDRDELLLDFNLSAGEAAQIGMVCGGRQQVLLQKIIPTPDTLSFFNGLQNAFSRGDRPVLLTIIRGGENSSDSAKTVQLACYNRRTPDKIALPEQLEAEVLRKAASSNVVFSISDDEALVFGEPLIKPKMVHFAGGGHVAQAAARLASIVGFQVRVMDDREEFANSALFPAADSVEVVADFERCLGELDQDDLVVIVTRGHLHDRDVLRQALQSKACYIGMIGSRQKRDATYNSLRQEGFTDEDFARVHCPIGLKLGGDSPAEIGLSIVAELQQAKSGLLGRKEL